MSPLCFSGKVIDSAVFVGREGLRFREHGRPFHVLSSAMVLAYNRLASDGLFLGRDPCRVLVTVVHKYPVRFALRFED